MMYDCIIVGAGPAGIVASIHLKRAGFSVLLIEKKSVGGLVRNARRVDNYLGFPEGITGKALINIMEQQLSSFCIMLIREEVISITKEKDFIVACTKSKYTSQSIILCTGTKAKKADIPGEEEEGVFYEVADIPPTANNVIVLGGGDVAFDYALTLQEQGKHPLIVMRHEPSCLPALQKMAERIQVVQEATPLCIRKEEQSIILECREKSFKADCLLIAVGREPNIPPLQGSPEGLFFAGDVAGKHRQVHIASGDALETAMKVEEYLNAGKNNAGK